MKKIEKPFVGCKAVRSVRSLDVDETHVTACDVVSVIKDDLVEVINPKYPNYMQLLKFDGRAWFEAHRNEDTGRIKFSAKKGGRFPSLGYYMFAE